MNYTPQVGDYFVVKTNGFFGSLIRLGTLSRWNHAGIYIGEGKIIEANPQGVQVTELNQYSLVAWNKHEGITDKQKNQIVKYAQELVGKPYAFWDIARLTLRIIGLKIFAETKFMRYLSTKDGYICSELVAESYESAGVIFPKSPAEVTPGDLAERIIYQ